jgi:hypothetical protein
MCQLMRQSKTSPLDAELSTYDDDWHIGFVMRATHVPGESRKPLWDIYGDDFYSLVLKKASYSGNRIESQFPSFSKSIRLIRRRRAI